ncbi:MAG: hypothetical protein AB7I59_13580 [Geminicoccaceae bacterium]
MSDAQQRALARHRSRRQRAGMVRLELQVRRDDVELVRGVARALADPAREAETRTLLREHVGRVPVDLKRLLAAAPLEGVDLERERDLGRPVEL